MPSARGAAAACAAVACTSQMTKLCCLPPRLPPSWRRCQCGPCLELVGGRWLCCKSPGDVPAQTDTHGLLASQCLPSPVPAPAWAFGLACRLQDGTRACSAGHCDRRRPAGASPPPAAAPLWRESGRLPACSLPRPGAQQRARGTQGPGRGWQGLGGGPTAVTGRGGAASHLLLAPPRSFATLPRCRIPARCRSGARQRPSQWRTLSRAAPALRLQKRWAAAGLLIGSSAVPTDMVLHNIAQAKGCLCYAITRHQLGWVSMAAAVAFSRCCAGVGGAGA